MHTEHNAETVRPVNVSFSPCKGMELVIDQPEWRNKVSPFIPISLLDDQVIKFTSKAYPQHEGVTRMD